MSDPSARWKPALFLIYMILGEYCCWRSLLYKDVDSWHCHDEGLLSQVEPWRQLGLVRLQIVSSLMDLVLMVRRRTPYS